MSNRPFFRESNIWRIIGGAVAFAGLVLMIVFPTESYPDAIIYRKLNEAGEVSFLFTIWHSIIAVGFLGFFPTLKEWTVSMFGKKNKQDEPNTSMSQ